MNAVPNPGPVDVVVVVNTASEDARSIARTVIAALQAAGATVSAASRDIEFLGGVEGDITGIAALDSDAPAGSARGDVVVVFGGDGTILRAAELAAPGTPLLGVNLGHVGFLAEAEPEDVQFLVEALISRRWEVEERTRLHVDVYRGGEIVDGTWALNEVSVEKAARERMIEVLVEVDGRPLSRWGCDGVVCATPTGSTAYALSCNGPILHPRLDGLVLVPVAPQALSNRPIVLPASSVIRMSVADGRDPRVNCDMQTFADLQTGDVIEVRRGPHAARFLHPIGYSYYATLRSKLNWHEMPSLAAPRA